MFDDDSVNEEEDVLKDIGSVLDDEGHEEADSDKENGPTPPKLMRTGTVVPAAAPADTALAMVCILPTS